MLDFSSPEFTKTPFLRILCLLSIFASGYTLVGAVLGLVSGFETDKQLAALEESREINFERLEALPADDPAVTTYNAIFDQFELYLSNLAQISINDGVLALVTIIAVMLMQRRQRRGFYLYLFTAVLGIIMPHLVAGYMPFLLFWRIFAYGLFAGLYATQLKHLH